MPAARISLPAPERGFVFQRHQGLVLITPAREKQSRAAWADEELPLRSLVVRESDGEVVSAGFPKFFNAQESGAADSPLSPEARRLQTALAGDEDVHFTVKIDGSLCVRSVIDGKVLLRTRGMLTETKHTRAMRAVAAERYPILLDPAFEPQVSLLFEFISPDFRIIINYPEADLVLLGAVAHSDLRLWDVPALAAFAAAHGLHLIELIGLPREPGALFETVRDLEDQEGVVARCDSGQTMVKLKSASYLALWRLRFSLTAKTVREICETRDVQSMEDFTAYITEYGADWELLAEVRPLVQTYLDASAGAAAEFEQLRADVAAQLAGAPSRKEFALGFAVPRGGAQTGAAFSLFDGRADEALKILRERALRESFAVLQAEDERRLAALNL
jgi:hypothetical protein